MKKEDKQLLEEFRKIRNIKHKTLSNYKSTLTIYTKLHNKTMKSMIREAEKEEAERIAWKQRKIRQRLITFRTYLIEQDYLEKTIREYLQRIKTIYSTYEIELHQLPKISNKNMRKSPPLSFKDLPTRELLYEILQLCNPLQKALLLFMVSGGCARKETLSLTIQDFIDATSDYHNETNIYNVLSVLHNRNDVVPMWTVYRYKTGKYYNTFTSNESTTAIVYYLLSRKDKLLPNKQLFKFNESYFNDFFVSMNNHLKLGKVGSYNRFRSHNLRKYHASALYNDGMSMEMVNELQGKAKNRTDNSYFVVNPNVLKQEYVKHMSVVCFEKVNSLNRVNVSDDVLDLVVSRVLDEIGGLELDGLDKYY